MGKYEPSRSLVLEALAVTGAAIGESNPTYSLLLQNLGVSYLNTGEFALAKDAFQRALAIDRKILGGEHIRCAGSLRSLGQLAYLMGHYPEAEKLLLELAVFEKHFGKNHSSNGLTSRYSGYVYAASENGPRRSACNCTPWRWNRIGCDRCSASPRNPACSITWRRFRVTWTPCFI